MKESVLTVVIQFGHKKGKKLTYPLRKNIRPTLARSRDVLFNWLRSDLKGWKCLDLFAGTGILGIQALSLGAAYVDFVERDLFTARVLKSHLVDLGYDLNTQIFIETAQDYCVHRADSQRTYDLIFLDPPFDQPHLAEMIFSQLKSFCHEKTLIYFEWPFNRAWTAPEYLGILKEKKIGDVCLRLVSFDSQERP